MPTVERGDVQVFVYCTGLLRAVGHDLRLSVRTFAMTWEDGRVEATFDPTSFRVDGAVRDGELRPDALGDSDRSKIIGNVERDVLETDVHDEIRFVGTYGGDRDDRWSVEGELELVGERREIETEVQRTGGRYRADLEVTPTRWGIEPYRALLGGLKLEDRVRIRLDVPDEEGA